MRRVSSFTGTVFVLAVMSMSACGASKQTAQDDLSGRADAILAALNSGEFDKVSSLMHYPPRYSEDERKKDAAGLADGLAFISSRFGNLVDHHRHDGSGIWYEVSAMGGDIEYWESVAPPTNSDIHYAGHFERFGPGMITIRFIQIESVWCVQAIIFRLDPSIAGARDRAVDTICEVIRRGSERDGEPVPPNLRELIDSQVPNLSPPEQKPRID